MMWRDPTPEELEQYSSAAIERIWQKHPQLRAADGGLEQGEFVDELICAMVVWLADEVARASERPADPHSLVPNTSSDPQSLRAERSRGE
jgi:hypothetical protein